MKKNKKFFLTWEPEVKNAEGELTDGGYWNQHDTLEDAYNQEEDAEIYEATPKRLGRFKKHVTFEPLPDKKPRRRKPRKKK